MTNKLHFNNRFSFYKGKFIMFLKIVTMAIFTANISHANSNFKNCPNVNGIYFYDSDENISSCKVTKHFTPGPELPTYIKYGTRIYENSSFQIKQSDCNSITFILDNTEFIISMVNEYKKVIEKNSDNKVIKNVQYKSYWIKNGFNYEESETSSNNVHGLKVAGKSNSKISWTISDDEELIVSGRRWDFGFLGPIPVIEKSTLHCVFRKIQK